MATMRRGELHCTLAYGRTVQKLDNRGKEGVSEPDAAYFKASISSERREQREKGMAGVG